MTFYEFVKDSINSDSPEHDIPKHISEVSIMYKLFRAKTDVDIYTSIANGNIGFSVLYEKEDEANELKQKLNGSHYTAYGRTYNLKAKNRKNTVYITMD